MFAVLSDQIKSFLTEVWRIVEMLGLRVTGRIVDTGSLTVSWPIRRLQNPK
jgi:hypothetical protein